MNKVYCYPRCTTCKKAVKWLEENEIEYEYKHIVEETPPKEEIKKYSEKSGLPLKRCRKMNSLNCLQAMGWCWKDRFLWERILYWLDLRKLSGLKSWSNLKNFKKVKKIFVIVLKIDSKYGKLNKLLNKWIFRFYCCYQFYERFNNKKSS